LSWRKVPFIRKGHHKGLVKSVNQLRLSSTIYPDKGNLFTAFRLCPYAKTKIVILGQDPYHGPGQAHGLAFSSLADKIPPSLRNVFKEVEQDVGLSSDDPNLTRWAQQGVLLLNVLLSVESGRALSHKYIGWQALTEDVLRTLGKRDDLVFMLWGAKAQKSRHLCGNNLVLETSHPSGLSAYRGFIGCRHFSKANAHLERIGRKPIHW
jgi:uracil-DNA glycosylase